MAGMRLRETGELRWSYGHVSTSLLAFKTTRNEIGLRDVSSGELWELLIVCDRSIDLVSRQTMSWILYLAISGG